MAEGVNNQGMQEGERPPAEDLLDKLIREAEEASPPTEGGAPKELQDQSSVLPPSPFQTGICRFPASSPAKRWTLCCHAFAKGRYTPTSRRL